MDSFQNPVGGGPRDPYENYRVEPVEAEKKTKEDEGRKPSEEEIPKKNISIAAQILLLYRRILDFFEGRQEKGITITSEKTIREHLLGLKACLDLLKTEDRSQDSEFLKVLSKFWDQCIEDALQFKRDTSIALLYKSLIQKIQSYPPTQIHTLGYYLTEHAGQKWIPFPFMEMIHKVHMEHQKSPANSALAEWTQNIQSLLNSFVSIDE